MGLKCRVGETFLIAWSEFLQVLEGDTVHFPSPKNKMSNDVVLQGDTCDAPLDLINNRSIDHANTEMMNVSWRMFPLHRHIPRDEQRNIAACARCFA